MGSKHLLVVTKCEQHQLNTNNFAFREDAFLIVLCKRLIVRLSPKFIKLRAKSQSSLEYEILVIKELLNHCNIAFFKGLYSLSSLLKLALHQKCG